MLTFMPVRTEDDVLKDLIKLKNKQNVLKIKENKLIDELITIKGDIDVWLDKYNNICINIFNFFCNLVLYSEMVVIMDITNIELNNAVLKRTKKYLNGAILEIVEEQIKENYSLIDEFFDELANEFKSIESYEQQ